MLTTYHVVARLVLATILSGCIGFERQIHRRAAGLRTHILVCLGSALITMTSMYFFELYKDLNCVDPTRIAAQIVSGIGFLGAGAILRFGGTVKGLTTAASLWSVAGIGIAAGCGFYSGAIATTALVVIALVVFSKMEEALALKGDKERRESR